MNLKNAARKIASFSAEVRESNCSTRYEPAPDMNLNNFEVVKRNGTFFKLAKANTNPEIEL